MNEKPVKVDIDTNEALRRIAKTPKGAVIPEIENPTPEAIKQSPRVKTAPHAKKGRG